MAARISIPPLVIERDNETDSWRKFRRRFEIAAITVDFGAKVDIEDAQERAAKVNKRKGAALLTSLGEEGMVIFDTFEMEVEEISYDELVGRFNEYFGGRENKTILRHRFLCMQQEPGESLSAFVQRVETASHQCQLRNMREDLAVHVVIKGLRDEQLKSELLKIAEIGMRDVMAQCARYESAERTLGELKSRSRRDVEVAAVERAQETAAVERAQEVAVVRSRQPEGAPVCHFCKRPGHRMRECRQIECFRCLEKGHVARDCTAAVRCSLCGKSNHIAKECREAGGQAPRQHNSGHSGRRTGPSGRGGMWRSGQQQGARAVTYEECFSDESL